MKKSSIEEIRHRFDADVERFSNLETGQSATVDAPLALELVTQAAACSTPNATRMLDLGCGAGNFSVKQLESLPNLNITLVDLSLPMLNRAVERLTPLTTGTIQTIQADLRDIDLGEEQFDVIHAAAVLHHLRTTSQWEQVFEKIYRALAPGGSFWIFDLIESSTPAVGDLMWKQYGEYLTSLDNTSYRDKVFRYIEKEDTPRSLVYQLQLLQKQGYADIEILHKNSCFAAFGAIKGR
ncbi:MAG: class I SAM-dependent methyltransferase [Planctomycetaceae bacterium]|nr:class I SAM-dependent methyltransferase [Planctomycetaceae bacterium]